MTGKQLFWLVVGALLMGASAWVVWSLYSFLGGEGKVGLAVGLLVGAIGAHGLSIVVSVLFDAIASAITARKFRRICDE